MRARSMVLMAPVILLVALFTLSVRQELEIEDRDEDDQKTLAQPADADLPVSTTSEPNEIAERGIWQISHDWIEIDPEVLRRRQEARRKTFGFDASTDPADPTDCADSNCRACLIDFVYGREF